MHPEEYLEGYYDYDAAADALLNADYETAGKLSQDAVKLLLEDYEADSEEFTILVNCMFVVMQYHVMETLMQHMECTLPETYAGRQEMAAAYAAWQRGDAFDAAWLTVQSGDAQAAAVRLFRAIDALGLDIADFDEIAPPDAPQPKCIRKQYGSTEVVTVTDAEITDDQGLAQDPAPEGKDFVLTDADGVKYHLYGLQRTKVSEELRAEVPDVTQFTAQGWIDGYTCKTRRSVQIGLSAEGSYVFSFIAVKADDTVPSAHVKWEKYEAWAEARIAGRRARQAAFIQRVTGAADN